MANGVEVGDIARGTGGHESGFKPAEAHAADLEGVQAIALGVQAIVIDHGLPESLKDVARKAVAAGIKVVRGEASLFDPESKAA